MTTNEVVTVTLTRAEWSEAVMALNGARHLLDTATADSAAAYCAADLKHLAAILGRAA